MIIFGIDPGVSGAISVLKKEGQIIEVYEMPTMIDGKKNKRQVNGAEVTNIFKNQLMNHNDKIESSNDHEKIAKVVVEHVTAMPGQGVTSMFNFGQSFGAIKGICASLNLPIFYVRLAKWKKHFELINASKDASRTKVIEMYPSISDRLRKKKDVNKADAILIARYFKECKAQFAE